MIMIKSAALIYRYADFSQFRLRIFTITRALIYHHTGAFFMPKSGCAEVDT